MAENKMPQVAQMFGKSLGEKFSIITKTGFVLPFLYYFSFNGLVEVLNGIEVVSSEVLSELLQGKVEIVEGEG
jgi:hypothetical protein